MKINHPPSNSNTSAFSWFLLVIIATLSLKLFDPDPVYANSINQTPSDRDHDRVSSTTVSEHEFGSIGRLVGSTSSDRSRDREHEWSDNSAHTSTSHSITTTNTSTANSKLDSTYQVPNQNPIFNHHHQLHSHPSKPLSQLNESQILLHHRPTPLSYLAHDRQLIIIDPNTGALVPDPNPKSTHPQWIMVHAAGMALAWFICLPLAIATSNPKHLWPALIFRITFILSLAISLSAASIYRSLTPDFYPHQKHSIIGWVLASIGATSSIVDLVPVFTWIKSRSCTNQRPPQNYHPIPAADEASDRQSDTLSQSPKDYNQLFQHPDRPGQTLSITMRLLIVFKAILDRLLVPVASAAMLSGVVIYTGSCRREYIHGCMAHFIKGGIFFWYGIISWTRYLGGYPELGWPWHATGFRSWPHAPSAEMVESAVVFVYGITNVSMERFGAQPGEPYTVKQIQHISIAAMFAFGGLVGVLLEMRTVRRLLFGPRETRTANPFPALCIAVTGLAMSMHAQEYEFQVAIHALWGALLGMFGVLRWLTYALPYERHGPPVTEALGAVCLIAGGMVFMESVEELTFSAMRHHFDDLMAFLNVTIAFTCVVMVWTMVLMTIKRAISSLPKL